MKSLFIMLLSIMLLACSCGRDSEPGPCEGDQTPYHGGLGFVLIDADGKNLYYDFPTTYSIDSVEVIDSFKDKYKMNLYGKEKALGFIIDSDKTILKHEKGIDSFFIRHHKNNIDTLVVNFERKVNECDFKTIEVDTNFIFNNDSISFNYWNNPLTFIKK